MLSQKAFHRKVHGLLPMHVIVWWKGIVTVAKLRLSGDTIDTMEIAMGNNTRLTVAIS